MTEGHSSSWQLAANKTVSVYIRSTQQSGDRLSGVFNINMYTQFVYDSLWDFEPMKIVTQESCK